MSFPPHRSVHRSRGCERGSLTALTAVMAVALLAMVGLVVDGGRDVVAQRTAMDEAAEAARAGAEAVSVAALRQGAIQIDPGVAARAATQFLSEVGARGSVQITGQRVVVRVERTIPTVLLGLVGVHTLVVSATASATDVHGVTQGD